MCGYFCTRPSIVCGLRQCSEVCSPTFTVPSLLPEMISLELPAKHTSFTKDVWSRNSFSVFPDFRP